MKLVFCERCEYPIGKGSNANQIYIEYIRHMEPISINKQVMDNQVHTQNNENNEQYELSDNKGQVGPTYEHTQH